MALYIFIVYLYVFIIPLLLGGGSARGLGFQMPKP